MGLLRFLKNRLSLQRLLKRSSTFPGGSSSSSFKPLPSFKASQESFRDKFIACVSCGERFTFGIGEQAFFASKGFSDPKRCPKCRRSSRSHRR